MSVAREKFPPIRWFQKLFGFEETTKLVYKNLEVIERGEDTFLVSKVNSQKYHCGNFAIRDLQSFGTPTKFANGRLNIIHGYGHEGKTELVNVLQSQALPQFNGATFQVASNFNCLEFVSPNQTAGDGVTHYVFDNTQGPNASLATGPSLVYRNYFVKHGDGYQGQIQREINLLKDTPLGKFVKHGYPIIGPSDLLKCDPHTMHRARIGVHRKCQVTTTQFGRELCRVQDGQFVNQIFTAALNFGGTVTPNSVTLAAAKELLIAQYKATILAAWENSQMCSGLPGSNKLVLTLLGGGVFNNPMPTICDAIVRCQELIVKTGLDVHVVCFSDDTFNEVYPQLKETVHSTKGTVINTR